jgi:hypothetical protein
MVADNTVPAGASAAEVSRPAASAESVAFSWAWASWGAKSVPRSSSKHLYFPSRDFSFPSTNLSPSLLLNQPRHIRRSSSKFIFSLSLKPPACRYTPDPWSWSLFPPPTADLFISRSLFYVFSDVKHRRHCSFQAGRRSDGGDPWGRVTGGEVALGAAVDRRGSL